MKNILVITYWSYKDALVQAYTLPYLKIINKNLPKNSTIHLVTLEQPLYQNAKEEKEQIKRYLAEHNIIWHPFKYKKFSFSAMLYGTYMLYELIMLCKEKRIQAIHTWCTPAGAIGYILSKLTGIDLILDSYEPHADLMQESGTWGKDSIAYQLLFELEKKQTKRAKHIIGCVESVKQYALEKYKVRIENFSTRPACVDLQQFDYKIEKDENLIEALGLKDKLVCLYVGKFGGSYLEQEVFDFFRVTHIYWKDKIRFLLLSDIEDEKLNELILKSDLDKRLFIKEHVPHDEVPKYMRLGDFAISPYVPIPSKRYGTPIKNGEYWAMGLPVVITPNISDDSQIITNYQIGAVLNGLNPKAYLEAVITIDRLLSNDRAQLAEKIRNIAQKYRSFKIAEKVYQSLYKD